MTSHIPVAYYLCSRCNKFYSKNRIVNHIKKKHNVNEPNVLEVQTTVVMG